MFNPTEVYIPLTVPARLRSIFTGEMCDITESHEMFPAGLAEAGVHRVSHWSAALCELVRSAPRGATPSELVAALVEIGCPEQGLMVRVRNVIDFYDRHRVLAKHSEIAQERRSMSEDVLRPVVVAAAARSGFQAYGGFREPNCPLCFRGPIDASRLAVNGAAFFVNNTIGPITKTPSFLTVVQRATSKSAERNFGMAMHRCAGQRLASGA
jgi:hypothetical protein